MTTTPPLRSDLDRGPLTLAVEAAVRAWSGSWARINPLTVTEMEVDFDCLAVEATGRLHIDYVGTQYDDRYLGGGF